jgi:hypothetical protein
VLPEIIEQRRDEGKQGSGVADLAQHHHVETHRLASERELPLKLEALAGQELAQQGDQQRVPGGADRGRHRPAG